LASAVTLNASPPAGSFKEGALFVQAGMLRQWRRCWCVARDGVFTVHKLPASAVNTEPRDGKAELPSKPLAELRLVLCSVKPTRIGSRFYLQLRSPNAQLTLQALTESGAQGWGTFFAKAIEEAYGVGGGIGGAAGLLGDNLAAGGTDGVSRGGSAAGVGAGAEAARTAALAALRSLSPPWCVHNDSA
jgi:hypothetical protein